MRFFEKFMGSSKPEPAEPEKPINQENDLLKKFGTAAQSLETKPKKFEIDVDYQKQYEEPLPERHQDKKIVPLVNVEQKLRAETMEFLLDERNRINAKIEDLRDKGALEGELKGLQQELRDVELRIRQSEERTAREAKQAQENHEADVIVQDDKWK